MYVRCMVGSFISLNLIHLNCKSSVIYSCHSISLHFTRIIFRYVIARLGPPRLCSCVCVCSCGNKVAKQSSFCPRNSELLRMRWRHTIWYRQNTRIVASHTQVKVTKDKEQFKTQKNVQLILIRKLDKQFWLTQNSIQVRHCYRILWELHTFRIQLIDCMEQSRTYFVLTI